MTTLRNSQLATVAVGAGGTLRASQLFTVSLVAAPITIATGVRASQLGVYHVVANNRHILPLGYAYKLPCWQPCTAFGTRALVVKLN